MMNKKTAKDVRALINECLFMVADAVHTAETFNFDSVLCYDAAYLIKYVRAAAHEVLTHESTRTAMVDAMTTGEIHYYNTDLIERFRTMAQTVWNTVTSDSRWTKYTRVADEVERLYNVVDDYKASIIHYSASASYGPHGM